MQTRTRFAPSPTGYMHVGNLRTALFEYLIAKSQNGKFVLRIEDTDRERYVKDAIDLIYNTLKAVGLQHDEGPDIGGDYGPYIQSERKDDYVKYAKQLIDLDKAYYCFCSKERLEKLHLDSEFSGYDRHCRDLSAAEVEKLLSDKVPFVIRQKVPLEGFSSFKDLVFGNITVENREIEDQILIKADGYPTYNFANVIDDHLMGITHIVRGCEYLSSTPKYNLLYEAFGWEIPQYIHLPLIMGKNSDGTVSKLSKRQGATSFEDLIKEGYLPKAILNYLAFLGWSPNSNREIFSLSELIEEFNIDNISKSPAIFDYEKLNWFNSEYIKSLSLEEFLKWSSPYLDEALQGTDLDKVKIASLLVSRVNKFSQIPEMVRFFVKLPEYSLDLYTNKRNKLDREKSHEILSDLSELLGTLAIWNHDTIYDRTRKYAEEKGIKLGAAMWPLRIAVSGSAVTAGGAVEILEILGEKESLSRINKAIGLLNSD